MNGSPAVTVRGSWIAVLAATAIVASSLMLVALCSERSSRARVGRV
ncbi:hypothetical protein HDC31_003895 [Microbacterium sp. JAI119]|nr:hypothetical protein [Microbacterium sp. JAI119]